MKVVFILAAFFPFVCNAFAPLPLRLDNKAHDSLPKQSSGFASPLYSNAHENESVEVEDLTGSDIEKSNFDGKGFAGYLAPYVLAVVASIGVTAAFVKFVLLDY